MAKPKIATARPASHMRSHLKVLADSRRLFQKGLAAVTREENRYANATARAYAIVQLDKEVVLVGVSAAIPYRIGGLRLQFHEPSGKIKVSLRVGNRRWAKYVGISQGTSHEVYAEGYGTHSFSASIYPRASRASAELELDEIARQWKLPSRIA